MVVSPAPGRVTPPPVLHTVIIIIIIITMITWMQSRCTMEPGLTTSWPTLPRAQAPPCTLRSIRGGENSEMDYSNQEYFHHDIMTDHQTVGMWGHRRARRVTRPRLHR